MDKISCEVLAKTPHNIVKLIINHDSGGKCVKTNKCGMKSKGKQEVSWSHSSSSSAHLSRIVFADAKDKVIDEAEIDPLYMCVCV